MDKLLSPYGKIFYRGWETDPGRSDYNIIYDQDLLGELDITKLAQATTRFIAEHVILHSHIETQGGELRWVQNTQVADLEYFANDLSDKESFAYLQKPFDLTQGPLYRFALIKRSYNTYRFIIILHHLVVDGSSADYVVEELSKYYNNPAYKTSLSLEEQFLRISQFGTNCYRYYQTYGESSKLFWQNKLRDIVPVNFSFLQSQEEKLKIKNTLNSKVSLEAIYPVGILKFTFPAEVLQKIAKLKRTYGLSLFLYGQIIYAILINRFTKQNKFGITYPLAIRAGAEFIYGAQINLNIIPYDFSQAPDIKALIQQTRAFIKSLKQEKLNHAYLPIADIISHSTISRNALLSLYYAETNLLDKTLTLDKVKATIHNSIEPGLIKELVFEYQVRNNQLNYKITYEVAAVDKLLLEKFADAYKKLFSQTLAELVDS
jgi:hypothetical protein